MTKAEFFTALQQSNPVLTKLELESLVDSMRDIVIKSLQTSSQAMIPGLIKFKAIHKPAQDEHQGINPFTKQPALIKAKPASVKIKMICIKSVKEEIK